MEGGQPAAAAAAAAAAAGPTVNGRGTKRNAEDAFQAPVDLENLPEELNDDQIEQLLKQADTVHVEGITSANLNRVVAQLDKKRKTNQEMRIKHQDEPDKFLKSEVDLDDEIKKLAQLSATPALFPEFVERGGLANLLGLLTHVNTDIAVDVMKVLSDFTDVINDTPDPDGFIDKLIELQLPEHAIDTLTRINEEQSNEDFDAVSNVLSTIENLTELRPSICKNFAKPKFIAWLIRRVRSGKTVGASEASEGDKKRQELQNANLIEFNRMYAAEILCIFFQNSVEAREIAGNKAIDGVERLCRLCAVYRRKEPTGIDEEEFATNVFDALCSLLITHENKSRFGGIQGVELLIRMLPSRNASMRLALKLCDYALLDHEGNCKIFVERAGLKQIFAILMKKGFTKKFEKGRLDDEEYTVHIIHSLVKMCTGQTLARVCNKFMESEGEKIERLLELHEEYANRVREFEEEKADAVEDDEDMEDEETEEQKYLDKCENGLSTLQHIDSILVRLANMGMKVLTSRLLLLIDVKAVDTNEISATVREYCQHINTNEDKGVKEKETLLDFTAEFEKQVEEFLD